MIQKNQQTEMRWNGRSKQYYIDKGYPFTKINDIFLVDVKDLPRTSKASVVVVCDICNKNTYFLTNYAAKKAISHICKKCNSTKNQITVNCGNCDKEFQSTKTALNKSKSGKLFCSNSCVGKCNGITRSQKVKKQCVICKDEYLLQPAHVEKNVACSVACQNQWQSEYLVGENANNFKGGERDKPCVNCGEVYTCNSPYQYQHRKFCGLECKHIYWENNTLNTEEFKEKQYEGNMLYRQQASENETKPERLVRECFESIGLVKDVDFFQEQGFFRKYFSDFYFPKAKLVVEVMGDYWHGNPEIYGEEKIPLSSQQIDRKQKDKAKKEDFLKFGFTYIEIWERDIYSDIKKTMNKIRLEHIPVTTARRTSKP